MIWETVAAQTGAMMVSILPEAGKLAATKKLTLSFKAVVFGASTACTALTADTLTVEPVLAEGAKALAATAIAFAAVAASLY